MKLYKNTLIISIVILIICVLLSVVFNFTCLSEIGFISFISDYMIGTACSIIVVIVTTFLQFKYEQRKTLNSILSDIQFFFFHYLLVVMSLDPKEKTSDKLWEYYYDETYKGIRKISTDLSSIEWFSKKKIKTTSNLHQAVLQMMYDIVKFTDRKNKKSMLSVIDTPHLKEIKDNAILLASANEYAAKEIVRNFERVQDELKELKQSQK